MSAQMIDVGVRLKVNGPYNLRPVVEGIKRGVNTSMGQGFSSSAAGAKLLQNDLKGLGTSLGDVKQRARMAQSALKDMGASAAGPGMNKLHKDIATTMRQLSGLQGRLTSSRLEFARFGEEAAVSLRRFGAFAASAMVFVRLTRAIRDSFTEAMQFQKAMVQLGQMGVGSAKDIKSVSDNITNLSKSLGASSAELADVSKYLKGAGMSITEVNEALVVLAKTSLSPTFKDLRTTQEGLLSLRAQFKLTAKEYASAFDSINAVSQQFAAEADDIVTAIKRAGSAFSAASGQMTAPKQQLQELISLFTAVQGTTKESADTIGTAFRTIFARLQSNSVVNDLRQMGIELRYTAGEAKAFGQNVEGQFVGAYTAVQRLSEALKNVPTTDPRFAAVVEKIGGQRQVSKVLPLIQQFPLAQKALATAQTSNNSLTRDSAKGMEAYVTKLKQVKEEFNELFRVVVSSSTFGFMITGFAAAASAATTFIKAMEPMIPLIAAMGAFKLGAAFKEIIPAFGRTIIAGRRRITGYSSGGSVSGEGNSDNVPALLTPKEFVFNQKAAASAGHGKLNAFNRNPESYEIVSKSSYGNDRDEQWGGLHKQLAEAIKAKGGMRSMYPERFAKGGSVKKGVVGSLSPKQVRDAFKSIGIDFDPSKLATGVDYMTPDSVASQVGGAADAFFNPGSRKIGVNANTNRDVTQLLGHEFAHALSTNVGTRLGVGNTATNAKGTIFNKLGQVGRKEFFGKKLGMFKGSLEDHYKNNLGVTDESDLNEEGFAHLFEQFVVSKQRQTAGQKSLKTHSAPDVQKAFSMIENQLLPAVNKFGSAGSQRKMRIAASSSPFSDLDNDELRAEYADDDKPKKRKKSDKMFLDMLSKLPPEEQEAAKAFMASKENKKALGSEHTGGSKQSVKGVHFGKLGSKFNAEGAISDANRFGRGEILTGSSDDYISDDQIDEELARKRLEKIGIGVEKRGLDADVKKIGSDSVVRSPTKRRRVGTSEGVAKGAGEAKIKDFVADTKARVEAAQPIPIADDSPFFTDAKGHTTNFEHPNAKVQAGLQSLANRRGATGDIKGTRDHILAGIQSGKYDLPALSPGESPPAIHAVKALAEELGFESNLTRDKTTGGFAGKFQKKMTTDELFAAAKSEAGLSKYGSVNDIRATMNAKKEAGKKFIMDPSINATKERLMRQVAAEQGASIQKMSASQHITKGHPDFDPEDTGFGQQVAEAKKAKASKASKAAQAIAGGAGLPAVRSNSKHQFINDYLKDKTFGSYDERLAAAKQAKDIYEGSEANGSGVFSAGGASAGGGGRKRGRPPGSGGGGMGDSPKVVSILEKILSEVKAVNAKIGKGGSGSGGSGGTRTRTSAPTKAKTTKTRKTIDATGRAIDIDQPSLGYTRSQVRHGFDAQSSRSHQNFNSSADVNDPFYIQFGDAPEPYRNNYDLVDELENSNVYEPPIRNPQRGPYQDLADNSHVNVRRYHVTPDFEIGSRQGLERRGHADPLKRINPRNTAARLEKARQLKEQRANSRFDADKFVSSFGTGAIPLSPEDGIDSDTYDFYTDYDRSNAKSESVKSSFQATKNGKPPRAKGLRRLRGAMLMAPRKLGQMSEKFENFASSRAGVTTLGALGVASAMAPTAIEQLTGTVEKPQHSVQTARMGSAIGGAIQYGGAGAGIGAAVGGPLAPLTAAIGGVVGVVYGFSSALKEADAKLKEIDFEKSFSKMTETLDGVVSGKMKLTDAAVGIALSGLSAVNQKAADAGKEAATSDYSSAFAKYGAGGASFGPSMGPSRDQLESESEKASILAQQKARSASLRDQLVPQAPQLREFGNKIAASLKLSPTDMGEGGKESRLAKFKSGGGGRVAEAISNATDMPLNELYDSFDKVIVEANKEATIRKANVAVIQEQTIQMQKFGRITESVQSASNAIGHLQTGADALNAAFSGSLQAMSVKSFAGEAHIGNLDSKAFNSSVDHITSSLGSGPAASSLNTTAKGVNAASISLPDIISKANSTGGLEDEGLANRIRDGLKDLPDIIKTRLSSVLDSMDPTELSQAAGENIQKLSDELIEKGFANVNTVLENAAKQLEERANAFNSGLIANQEMINKVGESFNKRSRLEVVAAQSEGRVRAAATGNSSAGSLSLDTLNKPFNQQQQFLTGMNGSDAMNPAAIGNKLRDTRGEINKTRTARDAATGDEQGKLSEQLATLQGNAQRLGMALENLADSSDRNAIIQEKINKLEEDRQGRLSFTEKLLTADPKQRREMQRNSNMSDVAAQQGNFAGFGAKQITGVLEHLSSLGNAKLPAYGGATGSDVRERLLTNSGMGIGTIDPRSERKRIGLMGQQAENDKTAVQAQDQIANSQSGMQQEFFNELKQIQQTFFDKLHTSLAEAEKRDISTQQGVISGKQKDLGNARVSAGMLSKNGFGIEDARRLNGNEDIGKLKNNLERQQSLGAGITGLKNSLKKSPLGPIANGEISTDQTEALTARSANFLNMPMAEARESVAGPLASKIKGLGVRSSDPKAVNQAISSHLDEYQKGQSTALQESASTLSGKISKDVYGSDDAKSQGKVNKFALNQQTLAPQIENLKSFGSVNDIATQSAALSKQGATLQERSAATNTPISAIQNRPGSPVVPPVAMALGQTAMGVPTSVATSAAVTAGPVNPIAQSAPLIAAPVVSAGKKKRATYIPSGNPYSRNSLDSKTRDAIEKQEGVENDRKRLGSRAVASAVTEVDKDSQTRQANRIKDFAPKIAIQDEKEAKRHARDAEAFKKATGKDLPTGRSADPAATETPREIRNRRRAAGQGNGNFVPPQLQQQQNSAPTAEPGKQGGEMQAFGQNVQGLNSVVDGLNKAMNQMGSTLGQLGKVLADLKIPDKIVLERNGKVEVVINGAEAVKAIKGDLSEALMKDMMASLQQQLPKMLANLPA